MIDSIENIEPVAGDLIGCLDEISPATKLGFLGAMKMTNWRPSTDGIRIEKRDGLANITTFTGETVYGWTSYYDSSANYCMLAVTNVKIWRKVASGAWTAIHTYSAPITHPVKILHVEGKVIIVTEIQNKMILPDGTIGNLGITAPTGTPTFTEAYESLLLDEDCAVITDWTDADAGSGASSQATFDSKSCMRFLSTATAGDVAKRTRTVSNIGPEYTVDFSVYFDEIGLAANTNQFELIIWNGRVKFSVRIDNSDLYVYSGVTWVSAGMPIEKDKWINFKFYVNTNDEDEEYVEVYKDGVSWGEYYCKDNTATTPGFVSIAAYGSTVATDVYLDWIKIGAVAGGNLNGLYRYAITYERSGTWPAESNPIKSAMGAATFVGAGLNDLTASGTYTGSVNKTIRVQIDGVDTPNTFKWSDDNGVTWASATLPIQAGGNYISRGVILTFAATTGHTSGDYWTIACTAFSAAALHQKVNIAAIPVSSDTQVTRRKVYRTQPGGAIYYLCGFIDNNTSTTFTDNIPDTALDINTILAEDRAPAPLGKLSEWWDDRLWIENNDKIYYSDIVHPEYFKTSTRYINMSHGEKGDPITGVKAYKGYLWGTKNNKITMIRKKLGQYYGKYDIEGDIGCIAGWSMIEVGGLLLMLSNRGWETFNGEGFFSPTWSNRVKETLATIDHTKLDYITTVHNKEDCEIWLSIPYRTGSNSAVVVVYNYDLNKFYLFDYSRIATSLSEARDLSKVTKVIMGCTGGKAVTCEAGTQDEGVSSTATVRSGWWHEKIYSRLRRMETEFYCPTGNTLAVDMFLNFDKDSQSARTMTGATPVSATDRSLRKAIHDFLEYDLRSHYFSIQFSNAENVGSELKIGPFDMYIHPKVRKKKIAAPD